MLARLRDNYLAVFAEYPLLVRMAVVTGAGQMAFALVNIYALPIYLVEGLRLSGLALGAASATFLLCETVLKFPMGRLSDRIGRKPLIVVGPLMCCLNPVLYSLLPARLWALVFPLRTADGVGAAALWPPLFALVGDVVRDESRAAAMSVMNTVYVAALGLAALAGSFGSHLTGNDRFPFYMASGLLLLTTVTAYLGLPQLPRREDSQRPALGARGTLAAETAPPTPDGVASYPLFLILLVSLLMSTGVLMLANFVILYLKLDLKLSGLQIGLLLAGLAIPVLLLGLPLGRLADRWGTARAVRVSLVASAAVMWVIPCCRSVTLFAAAAVVLVTSHILGTPAWLALVSQLAPTSRRGGVMAIVATAEGIGAALGPLLGGWLWDTGHGHIFYGSAAVLSVAAVVAGVTLRRDR